MEATTVLPQALTTGIQLNLDACQFVPLGTLLLMTNACLLVLLAKLALEINAFQLNFVIRVVSLVLLCKTQTPARPVLRVMVYP